MANEKTPTAEETERSLRLIDEERCRLISEGMVQELAPLLSETLVHIHANGTVHNKAEFLDNVARSPRLTEREDLRVKSFGDTAIMTGRQLNKMQGGAGETMVLMVTQVWAKRNGQWQQEVFQSTRIAAPAS